MTSDDVVCAPCVCCRSISSSGKVTVSLVSNGCRGTDHEVNYLEHVQAVITLTTQRRGQISIYLTSPMGTRSTLLPRRSRDSSHDGFTNWAFMTTHSWGELAAGQWMLEVDNEAAPCESRGMTDVSVVSLLIPCRQHAHTSLMFV